MNLSTSKALIEYCNLQGLSLYDYALIYETTLTGVDKETVIRRMHDYWSIMEMGIKEGFDITQGGKGKIIDRKAKDVFDFADNKNNIAASGETMLKAVSYSLGVLEVNSVMGKIVAAPTAGASGVLPGVFMSLKDTFNLSVDCLVEGLFIAGLVGALIARNASLSGAKGGCQAEVGSAAAMAAVAGLYMLGSKPEASFSGGAIALKNLMGLICDPVAGLVEVPCQKRNAIGVANSLVAIDLIRAGMYSYIPFDEVVDAMKLVGDLMPACHRETATGGIAITPTGEALKRKIMT